MPTAGVVANICKPSTWEIRPDYQGFKAILSYNRFDWGLGYFRRKKRKSTPTPTHPYTHTHKHRCGASSQFPVLLLRGPICFLRLNLREPGAYPLGWLAREPQEPTCSISQHLDYKHTQPAHLFIVDSRIQLRPSCSHTKNFTTISSTPESSILNNRSRLCQHTNNVSSDLTHQITCI